VPFFNADTSHRQSQRKFTVQLCVRKMCIARSVDLDDLVTLRPKFVGGQVTAMRFLFILHPFNFLFFADKLPGTRSTCPYNQV